MFPDNLVQQFRVVALQRLDRVEAAWVSVLTTLDDDAAVLIHREIHTLKGESRMLGFTDINAVCHKLEDLLEVARTRGYAVDEDFDLAINMALRFMAMLVRKRVGSQLQGIDLAGFIRQIDSILAEARPEPKVGRTTGTMPPIRRDAATPRVPAVVRDRLAFLAVDAFIEYAVSRGVRRDRLRASWHSLRDLIGIQRAVIGVGQLAKHKSGAIVLARDLGKPVEVVLDIGSAEVTVEILAAIDTAVLHLVRNAVDHGIESPAERTGKSPVGKIAVRGGVCDGKLVLTVADDGRGVALDDVRSRAIDLGLLAPDAPDIRDRWFDLVCQPSFSTRTSTSDVSGRGVGLDVVRSTITDVGGTLTASTSSGVGTTWTVTIPLPELSVSGHVFRVPGLPFPLVVDATWAPVPPSASAPVIDVASRLGFVDGVARRAQGPAVDEPCAGESRYISNGAVTVGIVSERPPAAAQARRLIAVGPPSFAELVTLDSVEGLLIHPERWLES